MRVLAIRGENLASLAEPFAIDFEQPPLADAGLFAITGPTGAGKSTILDALCLALFDRIPRLPTGHGVPVGREDENLAQRVKHNDVRSMLRRGAAEGYAEVDFLGNDNERYRARWQVRRARRRADGRVQSQQLTLQNLRTEAFIGQTRSEVLEEIRARLGLNFEQFRRSVLLAQGEFAAFLRATSDQRAGLLERITGTELYSLVSQQAFRRAEHERAALERLQVRCQGIGPLSDAQHAALAEQTEKAGKAIAALSARRRELELALGWFERFEALCSAERNARRDAERAQAALDETAQRRQQLNQILSLQPLRAMREAQCSADDKLAQVESERCRLQAVRESAARSLQRAAEARDDAAARVQQASERQLKAIPTLVLARELDTKIAMTTKALHDAGQVVDQARSMAAECQARLNQRLSERAEAHERHIAAGRWLGAHPAFGSLAVQWPRWERELTRLGTIYAAQRKLAQELDANAPALTETQLRLKRLVERLEAVEQEIEAQTNALQHLRSEQQESSSAGLMQRKAELDAQRELLKDVQRSAQQMQRIRVETERQERRLQQSEQARTEASAALAEAEGGLPQIQARLSEAERARDLAVATQDQHTAYLRNLLQDGSPCPVCGSEAHPWADEPLALRDQAAQQQQRVDELRSEYELVVRTRATAQAEVQQFGQTIQQIRESIGGLRVEAEGLAKRWHNPPAGKRIAYEMDDPTLSERLEQELRVNARDSAGLDTAISANERLVLMISSLQEVIDGLRAEKDELERQHREATDEINRLMLAVGELEHTRSSLESDLQEIVGALEPVLSPIGEWRETTRADLPAYLDRCRAWIHAWQQKETLQRTSSEVVASLDLAVATAELELTRTQAAADEATQAWERQETALAGLTALRAECFEGRPAELIELELRQALGTAQEACERIEAAFQRATTELASNERLLDAIVKRRTLAEQQRTMATQALSSALRRHQLGLPELDELLGYSAEWIAQEGASLEAFESARVRAQTILDERQMQREYHQRQQPEETHAVLLEAQQQVSEELDATMRQRAIDAAALAQDEENRARLTQLEEEINIQRERTRRWAALNELIGSADGKKFRVFAQSLTLEALLGYANAHLTELTRRYRLQRVPGSDLDLQVIDADMGDEVRGVHSLSGGESFLVSLALALGLASLSSQRAQVESLFIDEGFGSLDQDALELAISSLDSLQSLGRRVGVISHVQTLVERIGIRVNVLPQGGGRSRVEVRTT